MLGWRSRREGADQANPNLKQTGANCWEAQLFINGRHSGEEERMCVSVLVFESLPGRPVHLSSEPNIQ